MTTFLARPLRVGMAVFTRDERPMGEVAELATNYFILERGPLLIPQEACVPLSAVAAVEDDRVHLYLDAADAEAQEWSDPPVEEIDYSDYGAARAADFESGD